MNFITVPNIVKIAWTVAKIWQIFNYSRWRPSPTLTFQIKRSIQSRTASSCQISSKSLEQWFSYHNFLDISKWRPPPSWILTLFFTFGTVKRVKLRHRVKFCRNRSQCGWDIVIFFLDFQVFLWPERSRTLNCISVLNFVEIVVTAAEIWCFRIFPDDIHRHLGFLKFRIFNGRMRHKCQTVPNFVEIAQTVSEIREFQYYASLACKCLFTPILRVFGAHYPKWCHSAS